VLYAVVQVGGAIPVNSDLGKVALETLGTDLPVMTTKKAQRVLFSADLYAWWQTHQGEYDHFQTFDDWLQTDFAKDSVLPMYERLKGPAK
jgi:hypothetical protein